MRKSDLIAPVNNNLFKLMIGIIRITKGNKTHHTMIFDQFKYLNEY